MLKHYGLNERQIKEIKENESSLIIVGKEIINHYKQDIGKNTVKSLLSFLEENDLKGFFVNFRAISEIGFSIKNDRRYKEWAHDAVIRIFDYHFQSQQETTNLFPNKMRESILQWIQEDIDSLNDFFNTINGKNQNILE